MGEAGGTGAQAAEALARRRHEADGIARILAGEIAKVRPSPIPDGMWERVGPADADFMAALTTWEQSGTEADKVKLRAAYRSALAAWRAG